MTDKSKLWLRSLTIHRYEQFLNCPRIEFSPDDNLILGINGSGKTSLLRLLAAVLRWNYDPLLGQPFDIEFEQVLEVASDRLMSIHGRVQFQVALLGGEQVSVVRRSRNAAFNPYYDPRLGSEQQRPFRIPARSKYEGFVATLDVCHENGWSFNINVKDSQFFIQANEQPGNREFVEHWLQLKLPEDLRTEVRPMESWLAEAVSREIYGLGMWDLEERTTGTFVVHETAVDFTRLTEEFPLHFEIEGEYQDGSWSANVPSESEYRQWSLLMDELVDDAARQKYRQTYLPPVTYGNDSDTEHSLDMSSVLRALDAANVSFSLKIEQTRSSGVVTIFDGKGVEIRVRFASGTEVMDSRLTFGQKRLITIALGALLCGGSPLLVDEIDNGLHPRLVAKVMELIQGRQTFIASHNKLVVDLLGYESPEDIRRTIHICRRNEDGTQTLVALSEDQVSEVFEKISVGIMNPSDVLQREGLW